MGFFSDLFGGGGSSTTSTQSTDVTNENNNYIDIHMEELAQVEADKLTLESTMFEYAKTLQTENMTKEEQDKLKADAIKKIELIQNQQALEQGKLNTKYTIWFGVVGVALTIWLKRKGKK